MATEFAVHQCACVACQAGNHPDQKDHRYLNVILSRLDEQQRSWVAGRDARTQVNKIRHQERLAANDIQELRLQAIRDFETDLRRPKRQQLEFTAILSLHLPAVLVLEVAGNGGPPDGRLQHGCLRAQKRLVLGQLSTWVTTKPMSCNRLVMPAMSGSSSNHGSCRVMRRRVRPPCAGSVP